jgi:integrase
MFAPIKVKREAEIEVYSPEEFRKLLAAASPDLAPVLVLQGFWRLRSAEAERIRWEDVDLAEGHVTVGAHASKTASRRVVSLCASARQWLARSLARKLTLSRPTRSRAYRLICGLVRADAVRQDRSPVSHEY